MSLPKAGEEIDGRLIRNSPKEKKEPGFQRHAFVCAHERPDGASRPSCLPKDSLAMMRGLKKAVREKELRGVRVQKSGCLDHCEFGPTCVIYPEGIWYSLEANGAFEAVLKHLETGEVQLEYTIKNR